MVYSCRPKEIEGEGAAESETEWLREVPRIWDWEDEMRDGGVIGTVPSSSDAIANGSASLLLL